MAPENKIQIQLEQEGRVWFRNAIQKEELTLLKKQATLSNAPGVRIAPDAKPYKTIESFHFNKKIRNTWPGMKPVRLLCFDKGTTSNWGVPWHQDRVINLKERHDTDGFTNWSQKAGTWHCEPPEELLRSMLFVRVHLDKNTEDNGAMEIAIGSHREGKVPANLADTIANTHPTELTLAKPGDVLILNMLTLHRSRPSTNQEERRVLRIDYGPPQLPAPLTWAS